MSREMEKSAQSIEPEQIVAPDASLSDQLEIHTIPDKYYGAAMRASISPEKIKSSSDASPSQPKSSGGKKKSSVVWMIVGLIVVLLASAGGFVYFNQSLIFGNKPESVATTPIAPPPTLPTPKTVPSAPTNVSATATSQTAVQLNWSDTSNDEAGFRIERREPTTQFMAITSLPPNSTAYQDRTVSAQKDYLYRVIASNEGGDSAPSNETAAQTPAEPPPAPEPVKLPPAGLDTDSDGVTDLEEPLYGTNVNDPDTDHDSFLDGNEVYHLYNPASGLNTTLLATGLVKTVDSPVGWSIYVPTVWKVAISQDGMTATFTTGHGEVFKLSMLQNKNRQSLMDWYLGVNPGVLSSQVNLVTTKSGMSGLESQNKLHTYFVWDDWMLDFEYELDGQSFVNFRQTYEMMKNSLKLTQTPLVSAEMLQSYEQQKTTVQVQPAVTPIIPPPAVPVNEGVVSTGASASSSDAVVPLP